MTQEGSLFRTFPVFPRQRISIILTNGFLPGKVPILCSRSVREVRHSSLPGSFTPARYNFITLDVVVHGCLEARGRVWLNARVGVHLKCSERMPQNVTNCIRKMDGVATPSPATSPFWGPEKNYRRELIMKKRLVAVSSFLLYLEGKLVVGRWKLHACYDCHVVLCVIEDGERCMNWVEFRGDRTALEVTEPRKFMQRIIRSIKHQHEVPIDNKFLITRCSLPEIHPFFDLIRQKRLNCLLMIHIRAYFRVQRFGITQI